MDEPTPPSTSCSATHLAAISEEGRCRILLRAAPRSLTPWASDFCNHPSPALRSARPPHRAQARSEVLRPTDAAPARPGGRRQRQDGHRQPPSVVARSHCFQAPAGMGSGSDRTKGVTWMCSTRWFICARSRSASGVAASLPGACGQRPWTGAEPHLHCAQAQVSPVRCRHGR